MNAFAAGQSGPTAGVTRQADPSTMDTYQQMLDFSQNTRYAGRLWSDKTVFAYGSDDSGDRKENWLNNTLSLDESLDGVDGQISLNEDFLHVYSALGSSLEITGVPPVRTVIVFDNSGSMYSQEGWENTRIAKTIDAINASIDMLMLSSQYNEVSVVLFGDGGATNVSGSSTHQYNGNSTAVTILPMKHYQPGEAAIKDYANNNGTVKPEDNTKYLTAGWNNDSKSDGEKLDHSKKVEGGWVFVNNDICKLRKSDNDTTSDNAGHEWYKSGWNGWNGCADNNYTSYRNGTTNIQAGMYQGMQELMNANKIEKVGGQVYQCVPSLVMLTDGAVTDGLDNWLNPTHDTASEVPNKSIGFVNDFSYKGVSFVERNDPRGSGDDANNAAWNQFLAVKGKNGTSNPKKSLSNEVELANSDKLFYSAVAQDDASDKILYEEYTYNKHGKTLSKTTKATGESLTAMQKLAEQYKDDEAYMIFTYLLTTAYYKQAIKNAYHVDSKTDWSLYTVTVDMIDPKSESFSAGFGNSNSKPEDAAITSNPAMMDPQKYFNTDWLKSKKYLTNQTGNDNTYYDDYTIGDMTVEGIQKAIEAWDKWNNGQSANDLGLNSYRAIQSGWNFKNNGVKGKIEGYNSDGTQNTFPNPDHSSFFRVYATQKLGTDYKIPTLQEAKEQAQSAGFTFDKLNYNYATDAYYANVAGGSGSDLANVFVEIMNAITEPLFAPVGGMNDLGVGDAVTYMDPVGKYMDVKDVKNLSLFGELYGITKTAVYDYQWNDQYIKNEPGLTQGSSPLPEGWYYGTPTETGNEGVKYAGSPKAMPEGCDNAEKAWNAGWVYRVNYQTAAKFVPTLKEINNPEEALAKERKTEYTFYRIDKDSKGNDVDRNKLHMNPAYLTEGQTEEQALQGKTYNANGEHLKDPGVYALSDLRIWVEDSGDYSDSLGGAITDTNYDEALWVNIPVNMLPLRTVSVNLGDPKEGHDDNWTYTTNLTGDSEGYKASFPLRVFYTVGVSDDVIENSNRINIAGAISPEYIEQNKAKNADWATARNVSQGELEFFSNWYNPLNRYGEYATTNTDYSYGDPVTSFSPSNANRYYIFEKALPLYNAAYVYDKTNAQWRRISIGENLTEEQQKDVRTFDATNFGGNLLAADLDVKLPNTIDGNTDAINKALGEKNVDISKIEGGSIVLIKDNRLDDVNKNAESGDPFPSNRYYYLAIEYYELNDSTATWRQYVIARKGSEFGSAYGSAHITNGDMLCWHDVSGKNTQDYPYLSYSETSTSAKNNFKGDSSRGRDYIGTELDGNGYYVGCNKSNHEYPNVKTNPEGNYNGGEWVVCAKPGGLRVGDLAQNVQEKGGAYSTPQEQETIKKYVDERYKGVDTAASLNWGYYAQNVTRTANNYYVPTIGQTSNIEHSDIKVNVYLGNNGRLLVMDTTLLVTKLVEPPEGFDMANDALNKEVFNFQVFINGAEGTTDAVVVQWNELQKSWQRQFHYIDLELDSQLFLQTADGSKAMVDQYGRRIVAQDGGYVYADDTNTWYTGTPYYVFIGRNRDTAEKVGTTDTSFRVYHNNSVDDNGTVGTKDVTWDGKQGEKGTFYATTVWLVSEENYNNQWVLADGNKLDAAQDGFNAENYGGISHNNFELLSIDPNVSETTEISIETPYRTMSSYWTKQLTFGKNANEDGDGEVGKELNEDNLYDGIIPKADRADYFANLNNDEIAKHTAEFTLKHGQALLFGGISSGTVYRVTEKLTSKQLAAGYTLKEVSHNQQVGSISTYRPGEQKVPVYTKSGATYGEYGGGQYPKQYKDSKTENGLIWSVDRNGSENTMNGVVKSEEPFAHTNAVMWEYYATMAVNAKGDNHHQPNDPAVEDGTSTFWLWNGNESVDTGLKHTILDNPSCTPLESGGCDRNMGDGTVRHYMFKDGELVDKHYEGEGSGYIRNIGRYLVSPTVHFGVEGEDQADATKPAEATTSRTDYTGVYSVFGNTGTYEESANYVNTVEPDVLVITKNMVDMSGKEVAVPPDKEFTFTLKLTSPENGKITASDTLHYWKGNISDLSKAPDRNSYDEINALPDTLQLNKADGEEAYTATIKLKAKEAVVLYGLIADTEYTVTETKDDKYPVVNPKDPTQTGDYYTQTDTIEQNSEVVAPAESQNRADFINQLPSGILTVEKEILDNDPNTEKPNTDKEFGFTVTLTPAPGTELKPEDLEATKYKADGTAYDASEFTISWNKEGDDQKAEVTLKHGEKVVINGIPLETTYTVDETNRNGYTLKDIEIKSGNVSVHGKIASGKIEQAETAMTFVNVPAVFLPEAGGMGILIFCIIGALLIACAIAYIVLNRKKLFNKYRR